MKKCTKCKQTKPAERFKIDRAMRCGRSSWCKRCHANAVRQWKSKNKASAGASVARWQAENKNAMSAHRLVKAAVLSGEINKPDACEMCHAHDRLHGHHEDYDRPLDVVWLCPKCHGSIHAQRRASK